MKSWCAAVLCAALAGSGAFAQTHRTGAWWQSLTNPSRRRAERGWQRLGNDGFEERRLRARALPNHAGIVWDLLEAWYRRGIDRRSDPGSLDEAIAQVQQLQRRLPDSERGRSMFVLGALRGFRGDTDAAIDTYEEALAFASWSQQGVILSNIGELLMVAGRLQEADGVFSEALIRDSDDDPSWTRVAAAVCRDRLWDDQRPGELITDAMVQFGQAPEGVIFDPPEERFYYLGLIQTVGAFRGALRQRDLVEARDNWLRYLASAPDSAHRDRVEHHLERIRRALREARLPSPWVPQRD